MCCENNRLGKPLRGAKIQSDQNWQRKKREKKSKVETDRNAQHHQARLFIVFFLFCASIKMIQRNLRENIFTALLCKSKLKAAKATSRLLSFVWVTEK